MTVASAETEIRSTISEMVDAYVSRDLEKFQSFFAGDIVAMPPDSPPIEGGEAWNALLERFFGGSTVSQMVSETRDISVYGDIAVEWHIEAATYVRKDSGESHRSHFTGLWVFRRENDGKWRIIRYIWNRNPEIEPDPENATVREG